MRRFAVLLLVLSFVHPAQAQPAPSQPAPKAKAASKKPASPAGAAAAPATSGPCIGVIPLLGERFEVKKIGITVFGNEFKEIPVSNWGLDDLVVQRVQAAVGGAMVARRVAYARGAFDAYNPYTGLLHSNDEKSVDLVRQAIGPSPCARVVVVSRTAIAVGGNQAAHGVGIVLTGGGLLSKPVVHAVVHIAVYDGRSSALLKKGKASLDGVSTLLGGSMMRKLDNTEWPEPPEAANTPAMREAARKLLGDVLDKTLPELLAP